MLKAIAKVCVRLLLAAPLLLGGCVVEAADSEPAEWEETEALGQPLAEPCGPLVDFALSKKSVHQVHHAPKDFTWHKVNPCLKQLIGDAESAGPGSASHERLYFQTLYLLANPNVRFYTKGKSNPTKLAAIVGKTAELELGVFDRLVYWNEKKIAYDSMSAVDFGLRMLEAYRVFLKQEGKLSSRGRAFRDLGLAALGVITDSVADGGLRSRKECAHWKGQHCSWFHSVTRRDFHETTAGATLNKSLHPVRDLHAAADVLADVDALDTTISHEGRIGALRKASREGTLQLVYGKRSDGHGSPPNLFDFIPMTKAGAGAQRSWLYYGYNPELGKPHFLGNKDNDWKNCGYHMHVMELLSVILPRLPEGARAGFTEVRPELGGSVVDFIVGAYALKQSEGLGVDSKSDAPGRFGSCGPKASDPPSPAVVSALTAL